MRRRAGSCDAAPLRRRAWPCRGRRKLLLQRGAYKDAKSSVRTRAALVQWNLAHLNSVALTPRRCTTLSGAQAGCSPLHFAAKNDHVAATRLLLERGADKDARNDVRARRKAHRSAFVSALTTRCFAGAGWLDAAARRRVRRPPEQHAAAFGKWCLLRHRGQKQRARPRSKAPAALRQAAARCLNDSALTPRGAALRAWRAVWHDTAAPRCTQGGCGSRAAAAGVLQRQQRGQRQGACDRFMAPVMARW